MIQKRHNEPVHHVKKACFPCFRRQRNVNGGSPGIGSPRFIRETGSRIKGAPILVYGNEQGVRVMPVDVLGSVSMVAVRIHNGDPANAIFLADIFYHDRFYIDVAESPVSMNHFHGVVSRGPYEGKRAFHLPFHDGIRSHKAAARGDEVALGRNSGLIGHADVGPLNIFVGRRPHLVFYNSLYVQQPLFLHLIHRIKKSFFPFRMGRAYGPVKGGEKNKACTPAGFKRHS